MSSQQKKIEIAHKCKPCGGTGLYSGMGESETIAVVCHKCKGTGKDVLIFEYEEFAGRVEAEGVKRVLECNPGIKTGPNLNFGGIDYDDWKATGKFPAGSEMREYTCPAWWFQCVPGKVSHVDCTAPYGAGFPSCPKFPSKAKCWAEHDRNLAKREKK